MTLRFKVSGVALLSTLLIACGGGGSSSSKTPAANLPENLPEAISPEIPDDFVPFTEDESHNPTLGFTISWLHSESFEPYKSTSFPIKIT